MSTDFGKCWATLQWIDNESKKVIPLIRNKYTFGRTNENDFSFTNNKLLSSKHCNLIIDEDKKIWLVDTSTNGCIINYDNIIQKQPYLISTGDKISLVYKKNQPEKNITFQLNLEVEESKGAKNKSLGNSETVEPLKKKLKESEIESAETKDENSDKNKKFESDYVDILTCPICYELIHDCVSLQPCLHSFCSGCYSDWMGKSDKCPICRLKVDRISKNHTIGSLIDAFIVNNPDKTRSKEDIKELDEKNKITHDMLYPLEKLKEDDDLDESSDDDNEGSIFNSDAENNEINNPNPFANYNRNFGNFPFGNLLPIQQPYRFVCRQCPGNIPDENLGAFVCEVNQNHIMCQCCQEVMPDRNDEIEFNFHNQNCSMCRKAFCNLYWGCNKITCKKCLNRFQDIVVNESWLLNVLNDNQHESQLFMNFLERKNLTVQDVFTECVNESKKGNIRVQQKFGDKFVEAHDRIVCRECGFLLFQKLVYQYRKNLPNNVFFDTSAILRPDCHWGNECRTQKHNLNHAKNYNHICDKSNRDL